MKHFVFSYKKFNSVFLPKFLLMCVPGLLMIAITIYALNGNVDPISSSGEYARVVVLGMFLAMGMLVLSFPWYLSKLSLYRKSYITKQGDEIAFYRCANNLPGLDEKQIIYTAKDITAISIEHKTIYIYGSIEEVHMTRYGSKYIGKHNVLKIPNVFSNIDALF